MSEENSNPLFIHAILVIVVGAILLIVGGIGVVKQSMANVGKTGATGLQSELSKAKTLEAQAKSGPQALLNMKNAKPGLGALVQGQNAIASTWKTAKRFLALGWMVIAGIGMVVSGIYVFKEANWARYLAFGLLAFAVLYLSGYLGVSMSTGALGVALPLITLIVVSPIFAKILFDIMVEKFDEQPAAA